MKNVIYILPKTKNLVKLCGFSLHAKFGLQSGCNKQKRQFLRGGLKKDIILCVIYSKDFEI